MPNDSNDVSGEQDTKELISLAQAAKISGLSHGHLRLLAKQGKFWAIKIGRDWLTTEESLQAYLATDRRTGPKPKK
jgi:hypothetical protein